MQPPLENHGSEFATTRWTLVLAAGDHQSAASRAALETLCATYWYPLYVYARRRVGSAEQAQDLTQEFFVKLLEKNTVAFASAARGRFRSFLLTTLNHFLVNQWQWSQATKRGGKHFHIALDFQAGESRYQLQPVDLSTPETLFERQWALTLLEVVLERLRTEFNQSGKGHEFEVLKNYLVSPTGNDGYQSAAAELKLSAEAARQAAHRLRKRYRQLLRSEVAQTIDNPSEVDDEIKRLFESLAH